MRTYHISISHGRLILTARIGNLQLFEADFSCTEPDALLAMLRNELVNETGRAVEESPVEARGGA